MTNVADRFITDIVLESSRQTQTSESSQHAMPNFGIAERLSQSFLRQPIERRISPPNITTRNVSEGQNRSDPSLTLRVEMNTTASIHS